MAVSSASRAEAGSPIPWALLDPGLATLLRPVLPAVVDATVAAIADAVPEYRASMDGPFGQRVRRGVEIALGRHLDLYGTREPALDDRSRRLYQRIGGGERSAGRSLEALLAAYRTGARIAWDRLARAATSAGIPTRDLVALAEAIFVYIDELSGASAEGYASEQAAEAGYRDVLRSRLAEALLEGELSRDPAKVRALADAADWPLPERLAVAVIPLRHQGRARPLPTAPPDALLLQRGPDILAVVPDPSSPGRREALTAPIRDAEVYVGTVRPPEEAALSLLHARRVRRLVEIGMVPPSHVVVAADHLPELVISADEGLLAELARRTLAPLDGVPPARRTVLLDTLAAWLAHQGDRSAMAAALVVHPQTVSYRMGRLRALVGPTMEDPGRRLALALALRAARVPSRLPGDVRSDA